MTTPRLPAAVLWDMDGTIIDTESFWMAEERALVEDAGGTWTHEDGLELVGNDLRISARIILDRTPVRGTPEGIAQQLVAGVLRRAEREQPWRPGALELLRECGQIGVPSALVTMSWSELAQVIVGQLPPGTFDTVVTGDQVERGKPDPEPYLLAASRLGVDPRDCIAIEDSPTGATAARAAGVPTLVVPNMVAVDPQPGMQVLPTLENLSVADLMELATTPA